MSEAASTLDQIEPSKVDLARLKRMFADHRDLTTMARTESLTDQDYYDSKQWTPSERKALAERHQPDTVRNRIKPAVNGIVGVVERSQSEARAFPRNPDDEDSADVATDVLKYVADFNRFKRLKQDCFLDFLIPGSMAGLIHVDADRQVIINQVRWEEFFYDPRSRRKDFKDARYMGIAKWMYADDLKGMYAAKASEIEASVNNAGATGDGGFAPDQSFQDRPEGRTTTWIDRRQRRLMVVELYYREGTWKRCVFTGSCVLEEGDSPYLDHKGRPDCPIEAQSAYIDRENNRYGAVRDMRGPQDDINKRSSKLLHLLSVSQIEVKDPSAIDVDADVARKEAARPDGVIPYGWGKVSNADQTAGQAMLLTEAKQEIERLGPNPAVLGRDGADASGRALLARQQAGLVELGLLYGGLEDWELRVYRQCWARAKQYWTAPDFIRTTDDEGAPQFTGINQPVMGQPSIGVHPETGDPMLVPNVLGYKNAVAEMDVDITLESIPDAGTIAQEQFTDLVQLIGANPVYAQQVPFTALLKLSSIPHKRQVLDTIKQATEEVQAAQAAAQQQAQAAQMAELNANLDKTASETDLNTARAGAETANAMTKAHKAHADPVIHAMEAGMAQHNMPPPIVDQSEGPAPAQPSPQAAQPMPQPAYGT